MSEFEIRPDDFVTVLISDELALRVNAKYDRVDFFPEIGHFILKAYEDETGLVSVHLDRQSALKIVDRAELPLVTRTFMLNSEHEGYVEDMLQNFDRIFGD